jgi:hypothetical protein
LSVTPAIMRGMSGILIGSEALQSGVLTRHQLSRYRRLLPDVYAPRDAELSLRDRTVAAWLWSRRRGVVAGSAAAALHGAQWIDADEPVELIWACARPPAALRVRNESLRRGEVTRVAGIPVTTPARTAFDLGRHLARDRAVARLDALMWATPFSTEAVLRLAADHPGARGLRRLRRVLPLVDGGAASPRETWLRLLLTDAGFPRPTTQIPLMDHTGNLAVLDMGWKEFKVAAEYDGDQHRSDRRRYVRDQRRSRMVAKLGWDAVRVIKEDRPQEVIARVEEALRARGWRGEIALTQGRTRLLSA